MRVLIVEDKAVTSQLVSRGLNADGIDSDLAERGEDALRMAQTRAYDVICLDLELPGIDGLETCRLLREADVNTPLLMLTVRDQVDDRVAGLEIGADDYLAKPFSMRELVARLRALARRPHQAEEGRTGDELRGTQPSRAELRVLGLLPTGASAAEIGAELHLTQNTVRSHLRRLYRRLGVRDREAAVEAARGMDLIS